MHAWSVGWRWRSRVVCALVELWVFDSKTVTRVVRSVSEEEDASMVSVEPTRVVYDDDKEEWSTVI